MKYSIDSRSDFSKNDLMSILDVFPHQGVVLEEARNVVKYFTYKDICLNIKAFKIPNIINRFAYRYVRQSKAKRSFLYSQKLVELGVKTPQPIAYIEYSNLLGLTKSYYISKQIEVDYEFRALLSKDIDDIKKVLIAFTRFTYEMHKKGVLFIDHSPGNTLIKEMPEGYEFYLVDLNRTKFLNKELPLNVGIKNFYRLGSTPEMVKVIATEYARLRNVDEKYVVDLMMKQTMDHNLAVEKKKARRNNNR
jgi:hypothetical protein